MHHHGERKTRVVSMDLGQVQYELTMQRKYTKMFKPCFPVQFPLPNHLFSLRGKLRVSP